MKNEVKKTKNKRYKSLVVSPEVHKLIEETAEKERRTIVAVTERLLYIGMDVERQEKIKRSFIGMK